MNVPHHLAMQSEALVILLQETHCTDAENLVLPNYQLAGSSLSRKYGLATFVHERLKYTLLDQSPPTSEIEWLCVDVDCYKIVNVYKPLPTRLRTLDLPVFPSLMNPLLPKEQAGFRHGKSTVDQVVLLTQNIQDSFEAKKKAGVVFIDLTAAYDTVWHRGLTCKLLRLLPNKHMIRMIMELVRN